MENYYRELVSFLSARLGNAQAAEDVVHDAYVRVLERVSDTPIERPRAFRLARLRRLWGAEGRHRSADPLSGQGARRTRDRRQRIRDEE